MAKCRICEELIEPFINFGPMPIPNAFLAKDQFSSEYLFEMTVGVCENCRTFQVTEVPEPAKMFHENYAYISGTSNFMTAHFKEMAETLISCYLPDNPSFVVEIGSNDGITLQNFARHGIPHLGVEPSTNVANLAKEKGLTVVNDFFSDELAASIASDNGKADIIIATNVLHNIEDTNSVAAGVARLLKPKGVFVSEDPYLGSMIKHTAYDLIYAEHMYIWSMDSIDYVFGRQGLEIFDVEFNSVHGGCMRYFLCHKGAHPKTQRYQKYYNDEQVLNMGEMETYVEFRQKCEASRERLMAKLEDLRHQNRRVVGYGATAKSATVINYCGITPDHVSAIYDSTPTKQNKYSPGAHIPVLPPEDFLPSDPEYAVLFAWNHFKEINNKEQKFINGGGKWIFPIDSYNLTTVQLEP